MKDPRPTIDVARLREELEYVTDHPYRWRQGTWLRRTACGTVGCLAGNTVLNAGYRPIFNRGQFATLVEDGDDVRPIEVVAAELLGLNGGQAHKLFQPTNSLYRLWSLAERFTDGEVTAPPGVEPSPFDAAGLRVRTTF